MRVVAGSARGRQLVAPPGEWTRPTSDRVREAMFNALWSRGAIGGQRVLDLFAGSGALGIEALSRGALHATFVDPGRPALHALRRNLEACGFTDRATVVGLAAERYLARLTDERFDVAFCDPPYAYSRWERLVAAVPADLIVVESDRRVALPDGWEWERERRYGGTWLGFAMPRP